MHCEARVGAVFTILGPRPPQCHDITRSNAGFGVSNSIPLEYAAGFRVTDAVLLPVSFEEMALPKPEALLSVQFA